MILEKRKKETLEVFEVIDKINYSTPDQIEGLKRETENFLNKLEANQAEILAERSRQFFSPATLETFFRNKERNEKIGQILQFLLAFLADIPGAGEPFNPIAQFREYVCYEVALLLEADVRKAVFNEINLMGSSGDDNVWDFMERVSEKNRELNELIFTGTSDISSTFFTLCLVLEHLCLFWFDVKAGDIGRIRRSDILMCKLARLLQGQNRQT